MIKEISVTTKSIKNQKENQSQFLNYAYPQNKITLHLYKI